MIKNFSFIVLLVMFSAGISRNAYAFEISTTNFQGEENSIRVYLSQETWTLVMAWTTYCGECAKQYSMLSELHDAHKKTDLKVLGVSLDDPQNLQLIVGRKNINFLVSWLTTPYFLPLIKRLLVQISQAHQPTCYSTAKKNFKLILTVQ
jgi:hypothetical protein